MAIPHFSPFDSGCLQNFSVWVASHCASRRDAGTDRSTSIVSQRPSRTHQLVRHGSRALMLSALAFAVAVAGHAQTATTGALRGTVRDTTGAVLSNAEVLVANETTGEQRHMRTNQSGGYIASLLTPGTYRVELNPDGFEHHVHNHIAVTVTQTVVLEDVLKVASVAATVEVTDLPPMVNTTDDSLGDVVGTEQVQSLPLVNRNFTQIMDLSAGVTTSVTRADELGRGSGGVVPEAEGGGMNVQGARASDNNFQLNGININDLSGTGLGIAIPNPDTIQEFRVQTGMYDAQYGRNAGANVDIVTKGGSSKLHGSIFEFWRNDVLNSNDYFFKQNDVARPELKQNQFGGTLSGPVLKDKLLYFGSYQGTRQVNAVQGRQTFVSPLLTSDRSAAGIGSVFAGTRGYFQNLFGGVGPSVKADGSNVNPVALQLLQMKLPNGNYLYPTPNNATGLISLTEPATFNEDQYMGNFDYLQSAKNTIGGRFFISKANENDPFGGGGNLPGAPLAVDQTYLVSSISDDMVIRPNIFNQLRIGYVRSMSNRVPHAPFSFSEIGITSAAQNNTLPAITVSGSDSIASGAYAPYKQNTYDLGDNLSWNLRRHSLRIGGGLTHSRKINRGQSYYGGVNFATWPDFILGLDAADNGTGMFSNVLYSLELLGKLTTPTHDWVASGYFQDDYKLTDKITLNLGLRYEWMPPFTAGDGRATNFDPSLVDRNPTDTGSYAGYVVPANFHNSFPTGVKQSGITSFIPGADNHTVGPRIGLAWSLTPKTVLRSGYGIYYSSVTGNSQFESVVSLPWAYLGVDTPGYNGSTSFAHPFAEPIPAANTFPLFMPYTPSSDLSFIATDKNLRSGITQEYTLNLQTQITPKLMFELAYVGSKADHLVESRSINQANSASASSPIRGETTNTLANLTLRVPYEGFDVANFLKQASDGRSNFNAMEVTLKQNLAKGLQFLASYTWSKTMGTGASSIVGSTFGGGSYGNQNDLYADYGPANFNRPQRLTISASWNVPTVHSSSHLLNKVEEGWELIGVATVQSGTPLTFTNDNSANLWGTSQDHAYLDKSNSSCASLARSGSLNSRVTQYFNTSCFIDPPTISSDGGTDFGNTRAGMLRGPAQDNLDFSFVRNASFLANKLNVEFRAEFFNAFNHAQFANPDTAYSDGSAFGQITSTSVAPRIGQLAMKMHF